MTWRGYRDASYPFMDILGESKCGLAELSSRVVATDDKMVYCDLEDLGAYYCGAPDMLVSGMCFVGME